MHPNCQYNVLHELEIGKITYCEKCGNLRLDMGHLTSLLTPEQFNMILEDFKDRMEYHRSVVAEITESEEPVYICLNNNNLYLRLLPSEFYDLVELFELSAHMLAIKTLIQH